MAFLLTGERPADAALPGHPLSGLIGWLRTARTAHHQRVTLRTLLEYDEHRLDDLGISRHDVLDALSRADHSGKQLASRRARSAKAWPRSS
jgi:uncharacterized protein YjiS (DUF1127 family)